MTASAGSDSARVIVGVAVVCPPPSQPDTSSSAGAYADLLLFDPAAVDDAATYQEPHQLAKGMETIIVNGRLVRKDGVFATELSGRVVTPERR